MYPNNYNELIEMHSAAKRKMTIGIVLTAIGYVGYLIVLYAFVYTFVFSYMSTLLSSYYHLNVEMEVMVAFCFLFFLFLLGACAMMGIGIPFLVKGIIGRVKANNRLRALKREQGTAAVVGNPPAQNYRQY